jgi:hypothetical protein
LSWGNRQNLKTRVNRSFNYTSKGTRQLEARGLLEAKYFF